MKNNIKYFGQLHRLKKTYRIPASELIKKGIKNESIHLQEQTGPVLTKKLIQQKDTSKK